MGGWLRLWSMAVVSTALALGCGTRTSLHVGPETTGRGDAGRLDAGMDGSIPPDGGGPVDGGSLSVDCGRRDRYTAPRQPLRLEASAEGPSAVIDRRWELISTPPGASAVLAPGPTGADVTVTPDAPGDFQLRFTAADASGSSASCEVDLHSVVGPPVAICPEEEELFTLQDEALLVVGDGFDDEAVVRYAWEVLEAPPTAAPQLVGTSEPAVRFSSSTLGRYVLTLTVFDLDGATDACQQVVRVTGPPRVECPPDVERAPTRQPVTLTARASDDVGIVSRRWELVERPEGSAAEPAPRDRDETILVPDRQGRYRLRFSVMDVEGLGASCDVTVIGTPTPPEVSCPEEVETPPLRPVEIEASAVDDEGVVRWSWRVEEQPDGSAAREPSPPDGPRTTFTPDIAGRYQLVVTATDADGMSDSCATRVLAGNVDGLRVEMFWNTDGTDMDLHLLNPEGTRWTSREDCYYSNCNTQGRMRPILDWFGPDDEDDPRLDIDDTDGFGPENINITRPQPGTYRVAVHNYAGSGPNGVTVQIYCGGSTTRPRQTFGPVTLRGRGVSTPNDFWRVADVTIDRGSCRITDLSRADGPWIEVYSATIDRR